MKRIFDFVVALAMLLLLSPLLLTLALIVRLFLGSPVLFTQSRPGLDGKPFLLRKFRSMRNEEDIDGNPLPDEQRLNYFGLWLRRSSLDELPELLNVLRGEMSLVGPRPLLPEYLAYYTKEQSRRHEVLPGITGWAQVHGRNALSWEEKFQMDVWYVDNRNFWIDLKILVMTPVIVFGRRGVSADGHVTQPRFTSAKYDEDC